MSAPLSPSHLSEREVQLPSGSYRGSFTWRGDHTSTQLAQKCPDLRLQGVQSEAYLGDPRYEPRCIWPDRWRTGQAGDQLPSQVVKTHLQFDMPALPDWPRSSTEHFDSVPPFPLATGASEVRYPVMTLPSEAPVSLSEDPLPVTAIVEGSVPLPVPGETTPSGGGTSMVRPLPPPSDLAVRPPL